MSDLYQTKAVAVANELAKDPQFASAPGDHPFIDMIVQLLQKLMPLILTCFASPKAARAEMQNPSLFTRMRLRSSIRKEGIADEDASVGAVSKAVLKVAKSTPEAEYVQLASASGH